jgi:cyclophilin family peptidyl-prolyl cis-trans isomerase
MKRIGIVFAGLMVATAAVAADTPKTPATTSAAAAPKPEAAAPAAAAPATPTKDKAMQTLDEQIAKAKPDKSKAGWRTTLTKPAVLAFDPAQTYYARMVTNKGTILIKLMPQVAPMHVTSFAYLTKLGYYDGLTFHRVIPGFMAQGGCPLGTGTGGPGYQFDGEYSPTVKHNKGGYLSMANAGPGTDGSQFFLTFVATPWLDGKHSIFGEVVEGTDVLKALEALGSQSGRTSERLTMDKVTIETK